MTSSALDADDARFMRRALELAGSAVGRTAPNPPVGAVVVIDGQVVGEGATQPVGGPHAEIEALQSLVSRSDVDLTKATLYVTLEPCCHWGRTPPCTHAILAAGVGRVVVGVVDPYPPMQGKGLEQLRAAGVEVVLGVEAAACGRMVRGFVRAVTQGLPEVTCKVACSLDGKIATRGGESRWITGDRAREDGHRLRAQHDAIVVGVDTVIADDPQLTCRTQPNRDPVVVVLDSQLRIPLASRVLQAEKHTLVICVESAPARAIPAEILRVPSGPDGRVDAEAALRALAVRGLHRVLVEGGAAVHQSMIGSGLVDTLHLYVAPLVIPGGRAWLPDEPALSELGQAWRFGEPVAIERLGDDVRLTFALPHRHAVH